jgi:hypothetical protein
LDRAPRVKQKAIAAIVEFMGKKPVPIETIGDNTIVDKLVRKLYRSTFQETLVVRCNIVSARGR